MKTYIHKKLGWKAVQHTSPEYYKIYKSKTEDCYTLRSSLEIEGSEDWKETAKEAHEYLSFNDIAAVKIELEDKARKNGHIFEEEWGVEDDKSGEVYQTVKTIIGGEKYGCISYTPLHDFKRDVMQHYLTLMKDYDKYHSNIPTKEEQQTEALREKLKEAEESGFSTPPAETVKPKQDKEFCKSMNKTGVRKFTSTEDAELLADLENRVDELSNKLEILLKFESNIFTLLENHMKEKQKKGAV